MKETMFNVGDLIHELFDVGGPHSEQKKWIDCFEDHGACVPGQLERI